MGIHGSTESFDQTDGVMDGVLEGVSSNYKLVLNVMQSFFIYSRNRKFAKVLPS